MLKLYLLAMEQRWVWWARKRVGLTIFHPLSARQMTNAHWAEVRLKDSVTSHYGIQLINKQSLVALRMLCLPFQGTL